jgi:hypothetical protein
VSEAHREPPAKLPAVEVFLLDQDPAVAAKHIADDPNRKSINSAATRLMDFESWVRAMKVDPSIVPQGNTLNCQGKSKDQVARELFTLAHLP